ncbi:hypothetical protein [Methylobacterium nigriterrae]|uniref:hypothetical protein n=1 Tax=Methylobacterium nigriterrae TaxID=3127512 RepID=UPI0030136491
MSTPDDRQKSREVESVTRPAVEGSFAAPVIYFDEVETIGVANGVGQVMLSAMVPDLGPNGTVANKRIVVAHLRGSPHAMNELHKAIGKLALLASGTSGRKN